MERSTTFQPVLLSELSENYEQCFSGDKHGYLSSEGVGFDGHFSAVRAQVATIDPNLVPKLREHFYTMSSEKSPSGSGIASASSAKPQKPANLAPQLEEASRAYFAALRSTCNEVEATLAECPKPPKRTWLDPSKTGDSDSATARSCIEVLKTTCAQQVEYGDKIPGLADAFIAIRQIRRAILSLRKSWDGLDADTLRANNFRSCLNQAWDTELRDAFRAVWLKTVNAWVTTMNHRSILEKNFEDRRAGLDGEWGWDHYKNNATAQHMKTTQKDQAPDMDVSGFKVWKEIELAIARSMWPSVPSLELSMDNVKKFVKNVEKATVKDGQVSFPKREDGQWKYRDLHKRATDFRVKLIDVERFSQILEYSAFQRAICMRLVELWKNETTEKELVDKVLERYSCFCRSTAKCKEVANNVDAVDSRMLCTEAWLAPLTDVEFRKLGQIMLPLEAAAQNIQASLMAGDTASLQTDFEQLENKLSELQTWKEGFSAMHYRPSPTVQVGAVTYHQERIEGPQAPADYQIIPGMGSLDLVTGANFRLYNAWDGEYRPYFKPWSNTNFWSSRCQWLAAPESFLNGIKVGESGKIQLAGEEGHYWSCEVRFKSFSRPPKVTCWLTSFDIDHTKGLDIRVSVENVTVKGAVIKFTSDARGLAGSTLRAGYIAYEEPEIRAEVRKDLFATEFKIPGPGNRLVNTPPPGYYVEFPKGAFDAPPAVGFFLNSVVLGPGRNARINLEAQYITKDGAYITPWTWMDSILIETGVSVVAMV